MAEVFFYHLQRMSFEHVLPELLVKTLARDWRAILQFSSLAERDRVNEYLWTYRAENFLPHATFEEPHLEYNPILLTHLESDWRAGFGVRFLIGCAPIDLSERANMERYQRLLFIFDGRDGDELAHARTHYKNARKAGYRLVYWQYSATGKWEKSLEEGSS